MNDSHLTSARAHVLVVEDSSVFREMQGILLDQSGYNVSLHETPQTALENATRQHFDLVVIDYELPEMNGQQFMLALRKIQPDVAVIFVSGSLTLELAIQLTSQGVAGIFNKPANPKTLMEKINETLARNGARDTNARVGSGSPVSAPRRTNAGTSAGLPAAGTAEPGDDQLAYPPRFLFGSSDTMRDFTHRLWKVRDFRAVLLLQGEPGSPFELLARELAEISIFRDGPIMVCDAARFEPRTLIEVLAPSLLSHDAGTLVMTGVEELDADQQRVLENLITGRDVFLPFARRFRLVLAATNKLSERVDDGTFGDTLYYKVSSLTLTVPTLREMRADIVVNARQILARSRESGNATPPLKIAADAAEWIESQDWPGNYAELQQTLLNAVRFAEGNELTLGALAASWPHEDEAAEMELPTTQPPALEETERGPTGEARPPFPIMSALVAEPSTEVIPSAPLASESPAAPVVTGTTLSGAAVARAPAGKLFSRPAPAPRALAALSVFRPASSSYDFSKRLAESLAEADACAAH